MLLGVLQFMAARRGQMSVARAYRQLVGLKCLVNAVISMGRRNTQLEPNLH